MVEREDELRCRLNLATGDPRATHQRARLCVEGAAELVLGDLHPRRVVGTLEALEKDRVWRGNETKAVFIRLQLCSQQRVAFLDRIERPPKRWHSGAVAQRQHHHDVERRVRVRQRLGGLEGSQRAAIHALGVDVRG